MMNGGAMFVTDPTKHDLGNLRRAIGNLVCETFGAAWLGAGQNPETKECYTCIGAPTERAKKCESGWSAPQARLYDERAEIAMGDEGVVKFRKLYQDPEFSGEWVIDCLRKVRRLK